MPYLTPDTAPSDTICRTLVIPNDPFWIAIVNGALSSLIYPYAFEEYGTATPDDTAAVFSQMYDDFVASECLVQVYPTTALHFHRDSLVIAGNAIAFVAVNTSMFNGVWTQQTGQQGDIFRFFVFLAGGTYQLRFNWRRLLSGAKLTVKIDNTTVISDFDTYGTTVDNLMADETITISGDGLHEVEGSVSTRHVSSSGWNIQLGLFQFRRTGD